MSFDYFDRFFVLAAVGLGLILSGGVNLALGRDGRRLGIRLVATLAVCGAVVAVFAALTRLELAARSAQILVGTLLVVGLFGSAWMGRQVASTVAFFQRPGPRWGLVTLGGLATVLVSGFSFEQADEIAVTQGLNSLQMVAGPPETKPNVQAHAATDHGTAIVLKEPVDSRPDTELSEPEIKTLRESQFGDQVIRHAGPTDHSNCHGWVFAAGKFLLSPSDVELIIKENGYHETQEPHPGDLVIYRQGSAITHSAVVRYVSEGQPILVEGKWGVMGVFLHPVDKSFYGTHYTFYRSNRPGHVIAGIGGSEQPINDIHATAE